ncbi:MAG TPA: hypothetical protein VIY27_08220 [Myxococcota bacterium]
MTPEANGSKAKVPDEEGIDDTEDPTDAAKLLDRVQSCGREARLSMENAVRRTERTARRPASHQNLKVTLDSVPAPVK